MAGKRNPFNWNVMMNPVAKRLLVISTFIETRVCCAGDARAGCSSAPSEG